MEGDKTNGENKQSINPEQFQHLDFVVPKDLIKRCKEIAESSSQAESSI